MTVLVVGILLGLGLCGAGSLLSDKHPEVSDGFFMMGAYSFWLSLLGLGVTLVLLFLFGLGKKDRR